MTFRQFLEMKYLEWQRETGGRRTVDEFAKYLGVGRTALSNWWNNAERFPQGENVHKIATKLGLEVYDVLGLKRPNAMLFYIMAHWDDLPERIQEQILEIAEHNVAKNATSTPVKRKISKT